ncbi:type II secretion system protein I [Desulfobaculum xiamenense]|uniref:Type II secretion system protein I n=1 Tax=Desulfobaculum xiamenense TaxID=995050 RepID=A0A846QVU5_9BACT|nr:prepilin-type N-terminal cleavage/methylation domain-containing protein [Desulfobaculum xiamenense]NJB68759.1 type II secretion system protein I [Desulfobaculum xiamenense]
MRKAFPNPSAGFTFFELLVVMSIMAVGLVAVFQATISNQTEAAAMVHRDRAVLLAERRMAEWTAEEDPALASPRGDFGVENAPYVWDGEVIDRSDGVRVLRLRVSWGEEPDQEYVLETARMGKAK